jgi:hypothetical protein
MFEVFEQPWGILAAAGAVLVILLVVRAVLPERRRWWQWLLPVLIAAAAFGLDYLVRTDTEKIEAVIRAVAKGVEQENPGIIEPLISDKYRDSYHKTKRGFIGHISHRLSKPSVEKNVTRIVSIDMQEWDATAVFTVRVLFDKQSHIYQSYKSQAFVKVEMDLDKQLDKSWLISRIELLELDRQAVNWGNIRQHW